MNASRRFPPPLGPASAFGHSLHCLAHPASLICLVLLVVNDHLLKAAIPSGFTGKLSDFAGLFFFPFVVAAGLSLLGLSQRRAGPLAFSLTLLCFTLLKTLPAANHLAVAGLRLAGLPAQIVLDPTDLLALAMLWPAWQLWRQAPPAAGPRAERPGWAGLFVLAAASLASLATSCPPAPYIDRLAVVEGVLYTEYRYHDEHYAASPDAGRTWATVDDVPMEFTRALNEPRPEVALACDPADEQHCFRLSNARDAVEESLDGGQTWRAVWQVPPGRRDFMGRYEDRLPIQMCPDDYFSAVANDLIVLNPGQPTLVVAMGFDGVLVHTPASPWQRVAVLEARPTPFAAGEPWLAVQTTHWEFVLWALGGLVAALGLSAWSWRKQLVAPAPGERPRWRGVAALAWPLALLLAAVWLLALLILGPRVAFETPVERLVALSLSLLFTLGPLTLIVLLLLAWGLAALWGRVIRQASEPAQARRAARACLWLSLAVFAAGYLPFALWATGVLPLYAAAWALALILTILVLGAGALWLRRHA